MRFIVRSHRTSSLYRCAALALVAGLTAGCSSDFTRVAGLSADSAGSSGSYGANAASGDYTGAISTAPVGQVQSSTLAPPGAGGTQSPSSASSGQPSQTYSEPTFVGADASGWSAQGGSRVRAGQGDSVEALASRYGVPSAAIRQANGLSGGQQISPGQEIVIPVYRYADGGSAVRPAAGESAGAGASVASSSSGGQGGSHRVSSGETLYGVARQYGVSPGALASANGLGANAGLKIGQTLTIPGGSGRAVASAAQQAPSQPASSASDAYSPSTAAGQTADAGQPQNDAQTARGGDGDLPFQTSDGQESVDWQPAGEQSADAGQNGADGRGSVEQAAYVPPSSDPSAGGRQEQRAVPDPGERAASNFRWPVRGRVISNFGDRPNGQRNDGINVSVPEGTPVKAAENGVVVYAGNELKGFGNLVLVRHADDWVTAYAHNSELSVSRGDEVRRGQIIARAGKTGNVSSPQVHFEVRRGSTPVDPMKHLTDA